MPGEKLTEDGVKSLAEVEKDHGVTHILRPHQALEGASQQGEMGRPMTACDTTLKWRGVSSEMRQQGITNPPVESLAPKTAEKDTTIVVKRAAVTFVFERR